MINFRVIRIGDLIKSLLKISILMIVIYTLIRFFYFVKGLDIKDSIKMKFDGLNNKTFLECLDENIGDISGRRGSSLNDENIINKELSFVEGTDINEEDSTEIEKNIEENNIVTEKQENNRDKTTEVVEENNKIDSYTDTIGSVQIRNGTSLELTEDMLRPDIDFGNKKDIIIFHTHTCESYTASEKYNYEQTGNYRTTDLNYSVARVGTELTDLLIQKGFNVIHDTTYHDYPEYTGSYTRSLETVQNIENNTPAEFVIDLHRDAIGDSEYGPRVKIGDEYAAQLMFVMGSNEGGLYHPNWNENLKLAIKIQEKANEMYPGLFKPIMLTKYRYNQSVARGSCIIEVGATGNTLDESLNSMKYLAEVIEEVMK